MIEHRWEARARLEDGMTEARVGGGSLQLVTVCLSDEGAGEVSDEFGSPVAGSAPVISPASGRRTRAGILSFGARPAGRSPLGGAGVSERQKLTSSHLRRQAFVYLRQSSQAQLRAQRRVRPRRQYALVERAIELGFTREQVVVVDEDLGISGSGLSERSGFARLAAEVGLGHAGLVLGLEI